MSVKYFTWVAGLFVLGQILVLAIQGLWVQQEQWDWTNQMLGFNSVDVSAAGRLGILKMGTSLITNGLPTMLTWNYPILTGQWEIIRLFPLGVLSMGIVLGFLTIFIYAVQGVFQRFI